MEGPNSNKQPSLLVSIDLDDLRYYRAIHGLPPKRETPILFEKALPRFLEMCNRTGIMATIFVISQDLQWPEARAAISVALEQGHEVASHSHSHPYDLSRCNEATIVREVELSKKLLEDATGTKVEGFRAPGYNLSPPLLRAIKLARYTYDASVLPSPPYYVARALIIFSMGLLGKRSASIRGRLRDFLRPNRPFYWKGLDLLELPISAATVLRLPLIGTTLRKEGPVARALVRASRKGEYCHLEFHGLDFLEVEEDGLEEDLKIEPSLRVPLQRRLRSFEEAVRRLSEGRENVTASRLARRLFGKM